MTVVLFHLGELTMIQPARSDLVEGGKYTIVVRATDGGKPPLHSDVKVRRNSRNQSKFSTIGHSMFLLMFLHL
jgi:hypothetical protein